MVQLVIGRSDVVEHHFHLSCLLRSSLVRLNHLLLVHPLLLFYLLTFLLSYLFTFLPFLKGFQPTSHIVLDALGDVLITGLTLKLLAHDVLVELDIAV